jgi:hypothetical protein
MQYLPPIFESLNIILCRLMSCLWIDACFAPTLFYEPCKHAFGSLPHFMVYVAIMRMGAT